MAGEGTANHIWQLNNESDDLRYKFYCYLNPRNGENIRHVTALRNKAGFMASIDYSGIVFVWDIW